MKKYTKIYFDYFGYTKDDFVACEVCGGKGVDIHHIDCRGMGGSKNKDEIKNLMGLCSARRTGSGHPAFPHQGRAKQLPFCQGRP